MDDAYHRLSPVHKGLKEDYFTLLYLMREFGVREEIGLKQVAFFGNDYGIDGYFYDGPDKRNLILVQCKWTEDRFQFKTTLERLINAGIERVFGNLYADQNENPMLNKLKNFVYESKNIIDCVWVRLVFNGDETAASESTLLRDYLEDLESKRYVLEEFFGRKVDLKTVFVSNSAQQMSSPQSVNAAHKYIVPDLGPLKVARIDGTATMMIQLTSLRTLLDMYLDFGEKLFERNIRSSYGFSQEQSMVNNKIKKSLIQTAIDGTQQPEDFTFYHNGVTMKANSIQPNGGGLALYEPRVLNGAQTISSVHAFYQEHKAKKDLLDRLEKIRVVTKVVVSNSDRFVREVAINNNRQNPIEPWHLRANDKIQLEFEERFQNLGIFYERRENSFKNEKEADLRARGITQDKPVKMKLMGQTFLSLQGQVSRTSKIGEAFENDKQYHEMFRDRYLTMDLKKLVLLYKVQAKVTKVVYAISDMGEKYAYVPKGRYLTWALLIQGLLNDSGFDDYVEDFGSDMTFQLELGNMLEKMGTTRIRPIFAKTFQRKPYADDLRNSRYGFLRRNTTLGECMRTAHKEYHWDILGL